MDPYLFRFLTSLLIVLFGCLSKPQSFYSRILIAISFFVHAYGFRNTIVAAMDICLNLILVQYLSNHINIYFVIATNFTILYLYKIFGHILEPAIQGTFDISGVIMILTVKSSYLFKEYTSRIIKAGPGQNIQHVQRYSHKDTVTKRSNIHTNDTTNLTIIEYYPTIQNAIDYLTFFPTLASGPTTTFSEFISIDIKTKRPLPYLKLLKTVSIMVSYGILTSVPYLQYILQKDNSLFQRIILLYLYNLASRLKFHFIWNFADSCFSMYGVENMKNIDFQKVEFAESVKDITNGWNKFVTLWLKNIFFIPIRRRYGVPTAVAITYISSALLHGINTCYVVFTGSFGLYRQSINDFNRIIPFRILRIIQTSFFVTYFSMPFYILDFYKTLELWRSVYFYGHIYFTTVLVISSCYRYFTKPTENHKKTTYLSNN